MKHPVLSSPAHKAFIKSLPAKPGIYLISCQDGTSYLGASCNVQERIRGHLAHSGRFNGQQAAVIETLEEYCVKELRALEDKYLAAFNFEHNSMKASPYCYTAKLISQ
jgi:excinuclease UvrABC nuclease subunit